MAVPRGSFSRPFTRREPSRIPQDTVLAVGWHVVVRRSPDGADRVVLTEEDGTTARATVKAGAEVEITAWRPRRSSPALYRVRTGSGKEGWVSASSLERLPPPPAPKPSRIAAPVATPVVKRVARKGPKGPRKSSRAH